MNIGLLILLVALSGLFSGLNIGLLSISMSELRIEKKLGNPHAAMILPIRRQRNFLISTLILGNVIVNAIIPLFLNSLTTGIVAGIVSIVLITLFGEIIPQALCVRNAMAIGGTFAPFVKIIMLITYPISKPLAYLLDLLLGKEKDSYYSKRKMEHFVDLHSHPSSNLDSDEIRIIKGGLTFSDKLVKKIMTPWEKVYHLHINEDLIKTKKREIAKEGFSRVPVIGKNKNDIKGILFMKDLVTVSENIKTKETMRTDKIFFVEEDETLDDVLNRAIRQRFHLFIVKNKKGSTTGIVTLEDVVEEILRKEIEDETD